MSVSSIIRTALLGSILAFPTIVRAEVASDPNCWRADETEAARFEDFRLKVLVGALNCKNYLPGAAASYNSFLQAKKDFILANMYIVRGHFARDAGASEGADNFANYETLSGNRYSMPTFDRAKCETVDAYARMAATLTDADLVRFVDAMSTGPLPSGCRPAPRPATAAVVVTAAPPPALAPSTVMLAAVPSVLVPVSAVASVPVAAEPMTDAQRVAASTVATRRLLDSRAAAQANTVTVPAVTAPAMDVSATVVPAVAVVAPATAGVTPSIVATSVPVAMIVANPVPAPAIIPAALIVEKGEPGPVAPKADTSAPGKSSASSAMALALAEAAKALAVAAAAMAQSGTN